MTGSVVPPAISAVESADRIAAVGVERDGSLLVAETEVGVVAVNNFPDYGQFFFSLLLTAACCTTSTGGRRGHGEL